MKSMANLIAVGVVVIPNLAVLRGSINQRSCKWRGIMV